MGRLSTPPPPPVVLLVEDVDSDALLVEVALAELDDQVILIRVKNVDLALKFFLKSAEFSETPRADLVLLDINLPGKTGYELLEIMRDDDGLKSIRVVVLSTAEQPIDKARSLALGAFAHIGKPWTYTGYEDAVRKILQMIPVKCLRTSDGKYQWSGLPASNSSTQNKSGT